MHLYDLVTNEKTNKLAFSVKTKRYTQVCGEMQIGMELVGKEITHYWYGAIHL